MKCFKTIFYLVVTFTIGLSSFCQDMSEFNQLKAKGDVPTDFTVLSSQKVDQELQYNKNKDLDKDFFLNTRYYIDELLLSGQVLFNDPLSSYVTKVAKYTLRKEKALFKKLRFYVIKSTATNAFSTDQGIILITTGLLAQLENEAQLAFIIAHETSHYTEEHLRDGYVEQQNYKRSKGKYKRLSYNDAVNTLSTYNKDHELEADKKGIEIYLNSQYAIDEIYGAFQVLLYSYLPFEEKVFDTTYFDTDIMKIPGSFFSDTINPITLEEDYNDQGSTHPNIKKRIDKAIECIGDKETRGNKQFQIGENEFNKIRTLSRFTLINLNLADRLYANVLYEIYLLQNEFPNNKFLDLSFVKALYGLSKYKNHGRYNEVIRKLKQVEGESYVLHSFLKTISKEQLNVITYRHLYDMSKKYPDEEIFKEYLEDFKIEFVRYSKVDLTDLKNLDFKDYRAQLDSNLINFDIEDSIRKVDDSNLSKFKKIKLKKKLRLLLKEDIEISADDDFHLFALRDLVKDDILFDELTALKKEAIEKEEQEEEKQREEDLVAKKSGYHLGIDKLVVVDPIYENYKLNNNKNHGKSESKKISIASIYKENYKRLDLDVNILDSKTLSISDVDKYNEIGLIKMWMSEVLEHEGIKMISSSHEKMKPIIDKYGTSKFMFSGIYGYKERSEPNIMHAYGILLVYTAPIALADLLVVHNYFELVALEVDAEKDEIEFVEVHDVNLKGINSILRVYIYDILYQLSSENKK